MQFFSKKIHPISFVLSLSLFLVIGGFMQVRSVQAATCTFSSTESTNDFNAAANWTGCSGAVPGSGDVAVIPAATSTTMTASREVGALNATGTLATGVFELTVDGPATIAATGSVTSTAGNLTFQGPVFSEGTLGSVSGDLFFGNNLTNNGTFDIGSGTATSTGILTSYGVIYGRTGTLVIVGGTSIVRSTLIPGTGLVRYVGGDLFLSLQNYYDLEIATGTVRFQVIAGTASSSIANQLTIQPSARLNIENFGSTDRATSLTASTLINHGILNFSGRMSAVSTTGALVNTGSIYAANAELNIGTVFTNSGLFNAGTSLVRYLNNSATGIAPESYYQLGLNGSAIYSLSASTTASATTTIATGATLAIGGNTFNAPGDIQNSGLMTTTTGGTIVHPVDSFQFTDASGTLVTARASGDPLYVTLRDQNRNLNGTVQETVTIPVTTNASAGSDAETLTLTETTPSSGIFRNTADLSIHSASVTTGNFLIDLIADGVGTASYLDTGDAATTTVSLTYVSAPVSGGGSGSGSGASIGGGGGGISGIGFAIPYPTTSGAPTPSSTPVVIPPVYTEPTPTGTSLPDLSSRDMLLSLLGLSVNTDAEARARLFVQADARTFGVSMTEAEQNRLVLFIAYGISPSTRQLGEGERRALIRDVFETMRRADIVSSDLERLTNGQMALMRNLTIERQQVTRVLTMFRTLFGHAPNFQNAQENLAWNTLMYRIRFPRNLTAEQSGIRAFRARFGRVPTTPFDWSVVRVQGYIQ